MKFYNRKSTQKKDSYQARLGEEEIEEHAGYQKNRKASEKEVNRSFKHCESFASWFEGASDRIQSNLMFISGGVERGSMGGRGGWNEVWILGCGNGRSGEETLIVLPYIVPICLYI